MIKSYVSKIMLGNPITKPEAMALFNAPLEKLSQAANNLRQSLCGDYFDMCTIINAKSGKCSENCKFCAQSVHYNTKIESYPLLNTSNIVAGAQYNDQKGVHRYSIVTAGRNLNEQELATICTSSIKIKQTTHIKLCASLGLLTDEEYAKIKQAGIKRIHNNLETSENFFPKICTTHTFSDKVNAIQAAQNAGMEVCSGGIFGLGESPEDRIDMAFSLRELGIKSVPINILNPIKGTPFEHNQPISPEAVRRTVAIYRFIMPTATIRLAGGRELLGDRGQACLASGANAVITGDMLTTSGISIDTDKALINTLGFHT